MRAAGVSSTGTALRTVADRASGTGAPIVGLAGRGWPTGPDCGRAGGQHEPTCGDRWLQAHPFFTPPGARYGCGQQLAGRRGGGPDRYAFNADRGDGNGVGTKLVAAGTEATLWLFARGTRPTFRTFGELGEPATGAGAGTSRGGAAAGTAGRDRRPRGREVSGAVGARQPASLFGSGGGHGIDTRDQRGSGHSVWRLSERQLGASPATAR